MDDYFSSRKGGPSVVEDGSCVFDIHELSTHDNETNTTTVDRFPAPQEFGVEVGHTINLKHFEHTYGMAAMDDVVHTYYTVVRLTPHINGLVGVSTRTGTVTIKARLPPRIKIRKQANLELPHILVTEERRSGPSPESLVWHLLRII